MNVPPLTTARLGAPAYPPAEEIPVEPIARTMRAYTDAVSAYSAAQRELEAQRKREGQAKSEDAHAAADALKAGKRDPGPKAWRSWQER